MMNHKFTKRHEMISKARKNLNKNKKIVNVRDNLFQKICYLSIIEIKNDRNLKFFSFKFLKFSGFIFSFVK